MKHNLLHLKKILFLLGMLGTSVLTTGYQTKAQEKCESFSTCEFPLVKNEDATSYHLTLVRVQLQEDSFSEILYAPLLVDDRGMLKPDIRFAIPIEGEMKNLFEEYPDMDIYQYEILSYEKENTITGQELLTKEYEFLSSFPLEENQYTK